MPGRIAILAAGLLAIIAVAFGELGGMFDGGLQHKAIQYYTRPVTDPVYELHRKIQDGEVRLKFAKPEGYVRSLLEALDIPIESQLAVFSKTSLLARLISPSHPRTIFFNDSVAVTWIPGEPFVEFAAEDPQQGIIFYGLDNRPVEKPVITRHNGDCLNCHDSLASLGVPGMTVRSVLASSNGTPMSYLGNTFPDHRTPFSERWGGWYVTGKRLPVGHRGNARVTVENQSKSPVMTVAANLESLQGLLDSPLYLTAYSDVVALMVFEHQMHMMNLFTRVGWDIRVALRDGPPARAGELLRDRIDEMVDYLLFADEWPLSARVEGNSGFTERFASGGPRDSQGRSLRQFDLEHRLMRYPCSYMIYSAAFDGLPPEAKAAIYKRMWQILSGQEHSGKYAKLSPSDRQAVVEILRETKPELREYFQPVTQ
jgi:hypothetical protein